MALYAATVPSPAGPLTVVTDAGGIVVRLTFLATHGSDERTRREGLARELFARFGQPLRWEADDADDPTREPRRQLAEYVARERRTFELELHLEGTPFQRAVWAALRRIPYGATRSYGALAEELRLPGGARAVGRANHENPIAVVIPCHRVVGADGRLTGFGGGLGAKRALLDLERGQAAFAPGLFAGG